MKKKKLIVGAVFIVVCLSVFSVFKHYSNEGQSKLVSNNNINEQKNLTVQEKLYDFNYLYDILKDNYPYFEVNKRLNGVDWLENKSKYEDKIKNTKNDEEFCSEIQNILSELNNGHTGVLDEKFYNYVYDVYKDIKNDGYSEWFKTVDNDIVKKRYGKVEKAETASKDNDKRVFNGDNLKTDIIKNNEIVYIKINTFDHFCKKDDIKEIQDFLNNVKTYPTLIIDIRGNGGGDSTYWSKGIVPLLITKDLSVNTYNLYRGGVYDENFRKSKNVGYKNMTPINELNKYALKCLPQEVYTDFKYFEIDPITVQPENPVGFNGKIFLLVDKGVYSSSEAFAVFCKGTGFATLVGEKTGGDGIGSDPILAALPNSGYVMRFTESMGLNYEGQCNEEMKTEPDILINPKIGQKYDDDIAIQKVIEIVGKN